MSGVTWVPRHLSERLFVRAHDQTLPNIFPESVGPGPRDFLDVIPEPRQDKASQAGNKFKFYTRLPIV